MHEKGGRIRFKFALRKRNIYENCYANWPIGIDKMQGPAQGFCLGRRIIFVFESMSSIKGANFRNFKAIDCQK